MYGARSDSTADWNGTAGDGFRATMTHIGGKVDQIEGKFSGTAAALNAHASNVDTIRSRMTMARQVATEGGLTVTATMIMPPGPAPAAPTQLAGDATPEEKTAHANATAAQIAYARKVRAYQESGTIVAAARKTEQSSQNTLLSQLSGGLKWALTGLDAGSGIIASSVRDTSKFRVQERHYANLATRAARLTTSSNLTTAQRQLWVERYSRYWLKAEAARINA